jgi:hypothetical protein
MRGRLGGRGQAKPVARGGGGLEGGLVLAPPEVCTGRVLKVLKFETSLDACPVACQMQLCEILGFGVYGSG